MLRQFFHISFKLENIRSQETAISSAKSLGKIVTLVLLHNFRPQILTLQPSQLFLTISQ